MKSITQKQIKNQLIKIIKKEKIIDVLYEPNYKLGYADKRVFVGSTLIIKTEK